MRQRKEAIHACFFNSRVNLARAICMLLESTSLRRCRLPTTGSWRRHFLLSGSLEIVLAAVEEEGSER